MRSTVSSSRKSVCSGDRVGCSGREVEPVEVVVRRLDLAAVHDRVPEAEEDVLDLATDLRDQVEVPPPDRRAGHGDVDALPGQAPVELGPRKLRLARVDRGLEPLAERVQRHSGLAVTNLAQGELELALPAEVLDPDVLDLVRRRGRLDSCEGCILECLGVHGSAEVTEPLDGASTPLAPHVAPCTLAP